MAAMRGTLASRSGENKPKLLDQVRDAIRVKHYSVRTEQAYVDWRVNAAHTRQGFGLLMFIAAITRADALE